MAASAVLRPVHRVRLRNLKELIEGRFGGNSSECARAIKRSHTFMWQLLNQHRTIGEETARHIEKCLELGENALDAKMERTTVLTANDGAGNVQRFRMVPFVSLSDIDGEPLDYRPCPLHDIGPRVFCAEIEVEDMVELEPRDVVFADRADITPEGRKLYVVMLKGAKSATVLLARKKASGFVYVATDTRPETEYAPRAVKVIARVLMIIRLPK